MLTKPIQSLEYSFTPQGKMELRITIDKTDISEILNYEKPLEVKIDRIKEKRSLNANGYYQSLLDQLKDALGTSRDELHAEMIRQYGQIRTFNGQRVIVSALAEVDGGLISDYTKLVGTGEVNGKMFNHWAVLKGSSELDTKEFSLLLDGLISECKEQGIETMTPLELEKLKGYEKRTTV